MGVAEGILEFSRTVANLEQPCHGNEQATKQFLVIPFLEKLGYRNNPADIVPEPPADIGKKVGKKGEKVDYAILRDGKPVILVECKSADTNLNSENRSQLSRYFVATDARYGILTNGVEYRFYTDLRKRNVMDESPFLVADMLDLKKGQVEEICRFARTAFDEQAIWNLVHKRETEQKALKIITDNIAREFGKPSRELIRILARGVLGKGVQRKAEWNRVTQLTKRALDQFMGDDTAPDDSDDDQPTPARKKPGPSGNAWQEQIASDKALHILLTDLFDYLKTLEVEVKPIKWGFSVKRGRAGFFNLFRIWPKPGEAYLMIELRFPHGTVPFEEGFIRDISQIKKFRGNTHMIYIRNHRNLERAKPLIKRIYDETG